MKKLLSAAAAAACLLATPAFAQGPAEVYGNIGLSHLDTQDGPSFELVTARVGTKFVKYVGVEFEDSMAWEQGKMDGVKVSLRNDWAAYALGLIPITDNVSVFAKVGYGSADVKSEGEKESLSGARYGAGVEAMFNDANGVRIDYTRLDNSDVNGDAYTIAYVRKFF
ncbi:MAG: outer membrane beta-barrel protein [Ignavibacteriales bacterium]